MSAPIIGFKEQKEIAWMSDQEYDGAVCINIRHFHTEVDSILMVLVSITVNDKHFAGKAKSRAQ
jgi:hypothetical protein